MDEPIEGQPGRYWHVLEDGRIQCDVCPRYCKLHEGQRGLCFVRARQGDQMVLTTYGRSSGFCIDPIEKKPLNHFLPGTPVLSFGTAGCNLTCKFCQNWDISKARDLDRIQDVPSPAAIAEAAVQNGCRSVAFTYNDPVIFLEYAVDVAQACRERGIKTVAVSAGYIAPEPRYKNLCSGKLAPVLETLEYLKHETDVWFEITTLLIPGENDSATEIEAESTWVMDRLGPDVPLHFTAFHPDWKLMDRPSTPPRTLHMARRIAMNAGLRYVYTGNIHDPAGQATHCPACGAILIGRDWYDITAWHLSADGRCAKCGTLCDGVFEPTAGLWGPRRQPVRLRAPEPVPIAS
jgi:pyruvate formate lyase activating enzyme